MQAIVAPPDLVVDHHDGCTEDPALVRLQPTRLERLLAGIQGALEIADLPDTFVSEEITTYFPEDQCKLHVLALHIVKKYREQYE